MVGIGRIAVNTCDMDAGLNHWFEQVITILGHMSIRGSERYGQKGLVSDGHAEDVSGLMLCTGLCGSNLRLTSL